MAADPSGGDHGRPRGQGAAKDPLYVYNGGFLTQPRLRRILDLAGYDIRLGKPGAPEDRIGVWGRSPTAPRGEAVAGNPPKPSGLGQDAVRAQAFSERLAVAIYMKSSSS